MDNENTAANQPSKSLNSSPAIQGSEPIKPPETGKPETDSELQEVKKELTGFEKSTLLWTRVVVGINLITCLFIGLQWLELSRQLKDSQHSLEATERAYVNVQEFRTVVFKVGQPPEAIAVYKNTGLTPAKNAFVTPSSFIRELKSGPVEPVINSHWNGCVSEAPPDIRDSMGAVIPPGILREVDTVRTQFGWDFVDNGQQRNGILTNIPLEETDFEAVRRGQKKWFVVVYISYRDQFGGCHSSAEPFVYDFSGGSMKASYFNWQQYGQNPN